MESTLSQAIEQLLKDNLFSYSRLKLFEECPYRWFLKYVLKLEEGETLPLMFGKAVHKAIEEKMLGKTDKEALLEGWKEVEYYSFNLIEYEALFRRANVSQGEANRPNVDTEQHFVLNLEGEGSSQIQGYIDVTRRIFGTLSFTDWKTNRVKYEPMDNMQLALYAWALAHIHNVTEVTGTLFFLRFFKDNAKTFTFKKQEMENARQWALNLANAINLALTELLAGRKSLEECFPARANQGCANCPFADICLFNYPKIKIVEGVFEK
jgi:RecB family exonuclease